MTIENCYAGMAGARFSLRGNLHAHSTLSDGLLAPEAVIDAYAGKGYDFLELSDHDRLADRRSLDRYESRGLVLITGNEISAGGPHIQHVDASAFVAPDPDRQTVIQEIERTGGFAIVNHPNWQERFDHCPIGEMQRWKGYLGVEIYNGVICRLAGSPYAAGKWDMMLSGGRRLWGFASDDFHRPEDLARGWNVVFCNERSPAAVVAALRAGSFYASTGVTIASIALRGATITVETENAHKVVAMVDYGRRIAESRGPSLTVEVPTNVRYVRFECLGCGEEQAWTQPLFVRP